MSAQSRNAKRWKRENRPVKGQAKPIQFCRNCAHKLTRFGCPHCNPSLMSIGSDMVRKGDMLPEALSVLALMGARRSR